VDCVLQTEDGEEVERLTDSEGVLNRLIPSLEDEAFQCWRFIDPYGDTVFNRLQMPQFLAELSVIRDKAADATERRVLDVLERLAKRCHDEVHLYLSFRGD